MVIARVFDAPGWTVEQYDELIARMELGGHAAPGVLFNWATATRDGVRVVDVYESREVADRLAQSSVAPLVAELGLTMPAITEFEVHRFLTPGS
jgi:hypothetical protein